MKREPGEGSSAGLLAATASAAPPSLLSINRKAMEAERLARRQKQLAQQPQHQTHAGGTPEEHAHSLDDTQHQAWKLQPRPQSRPAPRPHPTKRKADDDVVLIADEVEDDDDVVIVGESTRHSGHAARRRRIDGGVRGEASAATPPTPKILPYATGVVKKTWVRGQPRPGDDIKIEEIWQKQDLELAILSSFQWDEEWMMARLDMNRTRLMLIAYAADEDQVGSAPLLSLPLGLSQRPFENKLICFLFQRKSRCGPTCPATRFASASRRCRPWASCTRSCSYSSFLDFCASSCRQATSRRTIGARQGQ